MTTLLLPHSQITNTVAHYRYFSEQSEPYFDQQTQCWVVFSYSGCKLLLESENSVIPQRQASNDLVQGELSHRVMTNLVRLANPPQHRLLRQVAEQLLTSLAHDTCQELIVQLIEQYRQGDTLEWVHLAKALPVHLLLSRLNCCDEEIQTMAKQIPLLTKMMLPVKSQQDWRQINRALAVSYPLLEGKLAELYPAHEASVIISSLMGLLIQSFDAGRGLLTNSVQQLLSTSPGDKPDKANLPGFIQETLRYSPAIHHTLRQLNKDISLQGETLLKGSTVILMLAAANRDTAIFEDPNRFLPQRTNVNEHLSFGAGIHKCLATHFNMQMTIQAIETLQNQYPKAELPVQDITYEALLNARLAKSLLLQLNKNG